MKIEKFYVNIYIIILIVKLFLHIYPEIYIFYLISKYEIFYVKK